MKFTTDVAVVLGFTANMTLVALLAMKVTPAVAPMDAGAVIEKVFASATVDFTVNAATPEASLEILAGAIVLPVPVLEIETVVLGTRLLFVSLRVTVTLDTPVLPSARIVVPPVAAIVVFPVTGAPATKVTDPVVASEGVEMVTVLTSALVEAKVNVALPLASVVPWTVAGVLPVPELVKPAVVPVVTGLLYVSKSVIVILDVAPPSVEIGPVPAMVDVNPAEGPGMKVTPTVGDPPATAGVAMVRVFASAFLEAKVQVLIPVESDELHAPLLLVTPVSVALKVGVTEVMALF